jgi:hypothetical protein
VVLPEQVSLHAGHDLRVHEADGRPHPLRVDRDVLLDDVGHEDVGRGWRRRLGSLAADAHEDRHDGECRSQPDRRSPAAFVVREQQLAREAAREPPDSGLLGEPGEHFRGGGVSHAGLVSDGPRRSAVAGFVVRSPQAGMPHAIRSHARPVPGELGHAKTWTPGAHPGIALPLRPARRRTRGRGAELLAPVSRNRHCPAAEPMAAVHPSDEYGAHVNLPAAPVTGRAATRHTGCSVGRSGRAAGW